jgi:uncharacterized protein
MKKESVILLAVLLIIVTVLLIFFFNSHSSYVSINGKKIKVEIADTETRMERGLMHRTSLNENSGMLFVYPDPEIRSFWMKNMLIPLDIIFIGGDFRIVDIKRDFLPCSGDVCLSYVSNSAAKYVLEVNSGFSEKNNLTVGESVEIQI